MNPPLDITAGQSPDNQQARPRNYLFRAIVLLLILSPICLLIGGSSLVTFWNVITGPPVISETPLWMRAVMAMFRVVATLIGFFMPIVALTKALKVNSEFDAGNYAGAEKASKSAAMHCRQGFILLVLMLIIMALDVANYSSSRLKY